MNGGGNVFALFPIVKEKIFRVGPSEGGGGGVFGRSAGVVEVGPHTSGVEC